MASIGNNLGGINPFKGITESKGPSKAPAEVNVPDAQPPSTPQDGASINFAGISLPVTPLETPAATPTLVKEPESPVLSGLETAAQQTGLTLSSSGALMMTASEPAAFSQAPGKPLSLRNPDLDAIKVSPDTVAAQNMVFMNDPSEVKGYFHNLMGDKPVRLATAGYSAPPEGYEGPTTQFLTGLAKELNGEVGLVTSPTADKGSIDAITSTVGQREGAPLGYITADSYLGYVNPDNFPADIDKNKFADQPKIAFPDADIYSRATAELSNSFLVTGGRNASVNDFKNAVSKGNPVVVLTNDDVQSASWDPKKGRVDNASAYLSQMLSGNTEGIPMDNPFNQDVQQFINDNREAIDKQVILVDAKDPGATGSAARHLRGQE
jgi:hypothetical protein